ncbi:MAG: hypothetical protein GY928_03150 [Colwellia sp.]|nr:hypothetical protein [Colwellia sp.]
MNGSIGHSRLKEALTMVAWPSGKKHLFEAATGDNHLYYADCTTHQADTHVISKVHFNKLKFDKQRTKQLNKENR